MTIFDEIAESVRAGRKRVSFRSTLRQLALFQAQQEARQWREHEEALRQQRLAVEAAQEPYRYSLYDIADRWKIPPGALAEIKELIRSEVERRRPENE